MLYLKIMCAADTPYIHLWSENRSSYKHYDYIIGKSELCSFL